MPPTLSVCNTDSLGEQIQRAFPSARVVKALNTVTASVMVEPSVIAGAHDLFVCGNDADAKAKVVDLLKTGLFLGAEIATARAQEMILPLWLRLFMKFQSPNVNLHVAS